MSGGIWYWRKLWIEYVNGSGGLECDKTWRGIGEVCKPCAARCRFKAFIVGTRFHKAVADILGPVTLTKDTSFEYFLAMIVLFTKYVVTVPLANQTAVSVAEAMVQNWFLRFGIPDSLHTDQGTNSCSQLLKDVCIVLGVDKTRTSAFRPPEMDRQRDTTG